MKKNCLSTHSSTEDRNYPSCFTLLFFVCGLLLCASLYGCSSSHSEAPKPTVSATAAPTTSSADAQFDALCNEVFAYSLKEDRLSLHYTVSDPTSMEISDCAAGFGMYSLESMQSRQTALQHLDTQLAEISYDELSSQRQLTYDQLTYWISVEQSKAPFLLFDEMLSPSGGFHVQLPILLAEYEFSSKEDINHYFALLSDVPRYFQQILDFETQKKEAGLFMSGQAASQVVRSCQEWVQNGVNSTAFANHTHALQLAFQERLQGLPLSEDEVHRYVQKHDQLLCECFFPAYDALSQGISTLSSDASSPTGLCHYPNGRSYYQYLVASATGSDASIEQLQQRILQDVTSSQTALSTLLEQHPEIAEQLLTQTDDPWQDCLPSDPEQILSLLSTQTQTAFPEIHQLHYQVRTVDSALEPYLSPAFYLTPPVDQENTEFTHTIYLNDPSSFAPVSLITTLAHEGFPGHLYHHAYLQTREFSPIRRLLCPQGYSEGWATYSELFSYSYLPALSSNTLSSAFAEYYHLNTRMTLAIYSLLELGIHYYYWDAADAYDFLCSYGFVEESATQALYDYICGEPASYTPYFVGYLEIQDLKERYLHFCKTNEQPDSERAFHEAFLKLGEASFPVLEKHLLQTTP